LDVFVVADEFLSLSGDVKYLKIPKGIPVYIDTEGDMNEELLDLVYDEHDESESLVYSKNWKTIPSSYFEEYMILCLIGLFHDIYYNPRSSMNESISSMIFDRFCDDGQPYQFLSDTIKKGVRDGILYTDWFRNSSIEIDERLKRIIFKADFNNILSGNPHVWFSMEDKIQKEYQFVPWWQYKAKRVGILSDLGQRYPEIKDQLSAISSYIENKKPKVCIYAGTFNPFHIGHLSIVRASEKIFDKVIISCGVNTSKQGAKQSLQERFEDLQDLLMFHQVESFGGFLSDFVNLQTKMHDCEVSTVRGIRTGEDLLGDENVMRILSDISDGQRINTIYIKRSPELEHISSSAIRNVEEVEIGRAKKMRYIPTTESIYGFFKEEYK